MCIFGVVIMNRIKKIPSFLSLIFVFPNSPVLESTNCTSISLLIKTASQFRAFSNNSKGSPTLTFFSEVRFWILQSFATFRSFRSPLNPNESFWTFFSSSNTMPANREHLKIELTLTCELFIDEMIIKKLCL